MNKLLLFLIMLPKALWRSMGADVDQLRAILSVRLTLDDRRPVSIMRNQKQKKDRKFGTIINVVISMGLGMLYTMPLFIVPDRILSLTIYFSLLLAIITFMMITDFSSVLFDSRDKFIIFPRPVSDRTIVLSRMLHVFIYLFRIVLPMSLPGWVLLGVTDGWKSAVLFILPLIMLVILVLFIVNGVYLLVLRLAKPEKFKDVISYFQVFTSILFFVSAYLLPRLFDRHNPGDFDILKYPWVRFTPPYWLAVCWSWVGFPVTLSGSAPFSILAIAVPLLCMYVLVKYLSPQFARRISGIDNVGEDRYEPVAAKRTSSGKLYMRLAAAFNRTDDARAGFIIAWLQSSRNRAFRMRVYPSFAFVPVYFIYLVTQHGDSLSDSFSHLKEGKMHILLMYYSAFVMMSAMNYLIACDQYKAAWVYYSTPIQTPGLIMAGALKAFWVKYFLPFFLLIGIFVVYTWGAAAAWDVLLALVNITLFIACMARVNFRQLPFSAPEQMKQGGNRFIKSLLSMMIPLGLGFGHYLALHLLWLKLLFLVLSAILLWLVWDSYANTTWANVIKAETE